MNESVHLPDPDENSDVCPDCRWTHERARLVRLPDSAPEPCPSCVWAYGEATE